MGNLNFEINLKKEEEDKGLFEDEEFLVNKKCYKVIEGFSIPFCGSLKLNIEYISVNELKMEIMMIKKAKDHIMSYCSENVAKYLNIHSNTEIQCSFLCDNDIVYGVCPDPRIQNNEGSIEKFPLGYIGWRLDILEVLV